MVVSFSCSAILGSLPIYIFGYNGSMNKLTLAPIDNSPYEAIARATAWQAEFDQESLRYAEELATIARLKVWALKLPIARTPYATALFEMPLSRAQCPSLLWAKSIAAILMMLIMGGFIC